MFHALTGCDTMSSFARRGKKTVCEDTARTHWGAAADAVLCTAWHTRRCYAHHREVHDPVVWPNQQMYRHRQSQEETLRKEQQCAAHHSNEGSSGGTCKEDSVLRWKWGQILLPAPELPPPTNWCTVLLRQLFWGSSQLHWAGFLQVHERVCETLHMQEGYPSVQSPLDCEGDCRWRWFHNIHVLVPVLSVLIWHCLCTRIFSTTSNTRPCSLSVFLPDIYRTKILTNI